ncbi:signal transduction histidine-protein kinase AfsQ2 [Streptomyces sulfonofaciens]|uniref:histidine kinase n=1 Tax=Streptomyces sulfonofaciens TaxID=68272 RepID=A0A919KYR2_9ACTN|nr:signal transduction histidine-protein kinase AfsQ2 [Streptomyces sulfonofaciens]
MTDLRDRVRGADPAADGGPGQDRGEQAARRTRRNRRRSSSLRLRLVVVFALVALTAAVSASGIAYWLNREAVLTRTQDAALGDFQQEMQNRAGVLPPSPTEDELQHTAGLMADSGQHFSVLLLAEDEHGRQLVGDSDLDSFTLGDVPRTLRDAVNERQPVGSHNAYPYHMYWQRIVVHDTPYLVGGAKVIGGGPTGYMLKSLEPEAKDLDSLAWSLGIATALALVGAALLAQAAATTVLKPVHRLGVAARRLGEGKLDTRLRVSGTDELAELSRTFNRTAEALEKRVADMSARDEASRRFVADMSHELRTPLTAITAVTEVLEEELDAETGGIDPMIEPAVRLVVSETRRLNDLVENLMEVTRFDAGTARLVLDDVDIADQITACIDARAWLDAVELDAERGIVARLDPRRLDVILANLIGNALKHGGSPVRVSVRTERRPLAEHAGGAAGYDGAQQDGSLPHGAAAGDGTGAALSAEDLVIAVRDHGPGIPQAVLPHVFDRFYKASASRPRSDGSGLGLSIALENAHIHGGGITASNAPEGGAVFTLRLPRYTVPPEEREAHGQDGDPAEREAQGPDDDAQADTEGGGR